MARILQQYTLLAAIFFFLTLKGFRFAALPEGSQSINCGGENYTDPSTTIDWEADPYNNIDNGDNYGIASKVESQYLQNTTEVMQTLRYFPRDSRNTKFCYSFPVNNGNPYLLRASFLYGNYDKQNDPPSFVVFLNSALWRDVNISSSSVPIVHELIFNSTGDNSFICLAPSLNSAHNPFISTIELRPLLHQMYQGPNGSFVNGYGLMLSRRIDYGANTTVVPLRFPDDEYDRIWEANTTGPIITSTTSSSNDTSIDYADDFERPPPKVMATAITTQHPKDNLTFVFEEFGGSGGFRIEMHFQEVEEVSDASDLRNFTVAFPSSIAQFKTIFFQPAPRNPIHVGFDQQLEIALPFQIALIPAGASAGSNIARGPLLNAIELYRWTPQPLSVTGTNPGDVATISKIQKYFKLDGNGQGDPCNPDHYGWTWIKCRNDALGARIIEIHLASFSLKGAIPKFISNLGELQKLDLSNNLLSGGIPNLTGLSQLEYLDLHNNKLNGTLSENLLHELPKLDTLNVNNNDLCGDPSEFETLLNFSYKSGNPNLCNDKECTCTSTLSTTNSPMHDSSHKRYIYATFSLGALYIVSILIPIFICLAKHRKKKTQKPTISSIAHKKGEDDLHAFPFNTKMFSYNEICKATLEFTNILGEGGFGKVYYGTLPNGQAVAVKALADASKQGLKEFSTEVSILSRVRHKNLVSLIGYCVENTYMLIYEYIEKGNLRDLIYGDIQSTDKPLTWITRLQIALDASQGLEYLHTGCDPTIIHRDVKSSNILLTEKMQAKVADFGLSRLKEGESTISHVSTINVVGTAGYLDPAYNSTNQLTDKSDVYSFGVVLFELICGRAPIDMYSSPPHIVAWARPAIEKGKVTDILDPMLANGYKAGSMWKVVDVAFGCVQEDRIQRPKMSQVTHALRESLDIEMDHSLPHHLQDISGGSSTSDGKPPTLQYIESIRDRLEPR